MRTPRLRRPSFDDHTAPTPLYLPVSFVVVGLVAFLALVILMIGARSPYTHANLAEAFDPRYDRTDQILVGADTVFAGLSLDTAPAGADPVVRGASLYVTQGCASCHALEGRGGPVGPRLVGVDDGTIADRVRRGSAGMPRFASTGLTDDEVAAIAAFLRSVESERPTGPP